MIPNNIFIIGCGNMGSAIIKGLIKNGYSKDRIIGVEIDLTKAKALEKSTGIKVFPEAGVIKEGGVIVLSVKPDQIKNTLNKISGLIDKNSHAILSVAAGIKISTIEKLIPEKTGVARCMPNINALIGNSTTAVCFNEYVDPETKDFFIKIINSFGVTVELEEKHFDAVTGLSGSGPAYIFLIIDALTEGGVLLGIPREKAYRLALNTVLGSAEYLKEGKITPSTAKERVTSPGGTTVEGLLILEEGGIRASIIKAVKAASEKSKILGKYFE